MKLTISFHKIIGDTSLNNSLFYQDIPVSSHSCEVRNLIQCRIAFLNSIETLKKSNVENGKYFAVVKNEGKKVHSYNKWSESLEIIHINNKSKKYTIGDTIYFPQNAGCSRAGQLAIIEIVDDSGLGLDFIYDISGKKKDSSQEFWEWSELQEIGVIKE